MKAFIKENWYKLMIGSSLLMVSFGFMIYSVSTAMANGKDSLSTTNSKSAGGVYYWVAYNGYAYQILGLDEGWGRVTGKVRLN